jgi:hypothetical protein
MSPRYGAADCLYGFIEIRDAKQAKTLVPMTWGKPQVPGVVP